MSAHLFKTARRQMRKLRHRGASSETERRLVAASDAQRAQGLGWRYEGLSSWSEAQLLETLARLGIATDAEVFRTAARAAGSPTRLSGGWTERGAPEGRWREFPMLAARELWRRLLPELPTAETVADEVDELLEEAEVSAEKQALWLRAARRLAQACGENREFFRQVAAESGSDLAGWMVTAPASLLGTRDEAEVPALYEAFARLADEKAMGAERAEALARLGQGAQALVEVEKLRAEHPDDPLVLLKAGAVYEAAGEPAQAQELFRRYEEARAGAAARGAMAAAAKAGVDLPPMSARRPGRNELCPCGSGRKYKKCHGLAS